jgi:lipopolysaccharide transport system ATP-binding protein
MSAIIKVENLGKKYIIRHEHPERYVALRDVMARKAKKIFSFPKFLRPTIAKIDFEEFWALKDLDFEIQQGDRMGIIGRNGAGKSTLLKILSRITEPSTGRITLNGRVASLLEVGTGFHPELTGRENIFLNGAILGMSRVDIRRKFDQIVDFSGVEKFLDTPVKRYSSGMYVRLAFAVAAHLEPEILIVDEVLAVGDAEFQNKCLGKMEDVSKNEGRTVLFVSHNMGVMKALCTHGILLKNGQVVFNGVMNETIKEYVSNQVKGGIKGQITPSMRQLNTGEAFIRYVSLTDGNGGLTEDFYYHENIRILLEIEIVKHITNALLDIKILSEEDIVVAHNMNTYIDKQPQNLSQGKWRIQVCLENFLAPGKYSITAGIHHSNGTTIEYVEDVYSFNVLKTAQDDTMSYEYGWVFGYHHPKGIWKFSTHNDTE